MYSELLKDADSRSAGRNLLHQDEKSLFLGIRFTQGLALVSPALEKHVSGQLGEKSALLKERRKAREERGMVAEVPYVAPPAGGGQERAAKAKPKAKAKEKG